MLLLAVTIASCSSAVKDEPATLGKAIEKVLAHGELKDNSNQKKVSFRSGTFQYCVIVDTKDSTITTARAGLFNIELECWSVDTRTGKLKSFLNKDFLFLSSDKSIPEQKQLRQHFEDAQNNVVKLICEKF